MSRVLSKRSARGPAAVGGESAARVAAGAGRGKSGPNPARSARGEFVQDSCQAGGNDRTVSMVGGAWRSDRYRGYVLRGRWFKDDRYGPLRNAAWMVRNARVGEAINPASLLVVLHEAKGLLAAGEPLEDVLEAFAELLMHP